MTIISGSRRQIALLFAILFTVAALVIWIRTETVKATYAYIQQEKEFRQLQQETQSARVRWLRLTTPRRLEAMARSLSLEPPRRDQLFRYEPDKVSASPSPRGTTVSASPSPRGHKGASAHANP